MTGSSITAFTAGSGKGGVVTIASPNADLSMAARSAITSQSSSEGDAGKVILTARSLDMRDNSLVTSSVFAGSGIGGNADEVTINVSGDANLSGLSVIASDAATAAAKNAGSVAVTVGGTLRMSSLAQISADTSSQVAPDALTRAASVSVTAGAINAEDFFITTSALGTRDAGSVAVRSTNGSINVAGGFIGSEAFSVAQGGGAGSVSLVSSDSVRIVDQIISSDSSSALSRRSGSVSITAVNTIEALDGQITATTSSNVASPPSSVQLQARQVALADSRVRSSTHGLQSAGGVSISAGEDLTVSNTDLSAVSFAGAAGDAGSVSLSAGRDLFLRSGSSASSASSGSGKAGNVSVAIGRTGLVDGLSRIDTDISGNASGAGQVGITGANATLTFSGSGSGASSSTANGVKGGGVNISVGQLNVTNGAAIEATSSSGASGAGGDVTVNANALVLDTGASIASSSFGSGSAGSVTIGTTGNATIRNGSAIESAVNGAAGGDAGQVNVTSSGGQLSLASNSRISTSTSSTSAPGNPNAAGTGAINLSAASVTVDGASVVTANATGARNAGSIDIRSTVGAVTIGSPGDASAISSTGFGMNGAGGAGSITVNAKTDLRIGGKVESEAFPAARRAGSIGLTAGNLIDINGGSVQASTFSNSATTPANVQLQAGDISIRGGGVVTDTFGTQAGGNITLTATRAVTLDGIVSSETFGRGDGGSITIVADSLTTGRAPEFPAQIFTNSQNFLATGPGAPVLGEAGDIRINVRQVDLLETEIASNTAGTGNAGQIVFDRADASILLRNSVISSGTSSSGDAGLVSIAGDNLRALRTTVQSRSTRAGDGGDIIIGVGELVLDDVSEVSSSSSGTGDAGSVTVTTTRNATVRASTVSSDVNGANGGDAGQVSVTSSGQLSLASSSQISTSTSTASAPGNPNAPGTGSIILRGANVTVDGGSVVTANTTGARNAGSIDIRATAGNTLLGSASSGAQITSASNAAGGAGSIAISATGDVRTAGGTNISTDAAGASTRRSGSLLLTAGNSVSIGAGAISATTSSNVAGAPATIQITAPDVVIRDANVTSKTTGAQSAGDISVTAARTIGLHNSEFDNGTEASGNGGSITLVTDVLTMRESVVGTDAGVQNFSATGKAGDVRVTARQIDARSANTFSGDGFSSGTHGRGNAGRVIFDRPDANIYLENQTIFTVTSGAGATGGDVSIVADILRLVGSGISSGAFTDFDGAATGDGGNIDITVRRLELGAVDPNTGFVSSGRSEIRSSGGIGNAGDITVRVAEALVMHGSNIDTAGGTTGNAGTITVLAPQAAMTMNFSDINSSAGQSSNAGTIDIGARTLDMDRSNITSSADFTSRNAGSVDVTVGGVLSLVDSEISATTSTSRAPDPATQAASVSVSAASVSSEASTITTSSSGARGAGTVTVTSPGEIVLQFGSEISSSASGAGAAGSVSIGSAVSKATSIQVLEGSSIETSSSNSTAAGSISVFATDVIVDGEGSKIASENTSTTGGAAGSILIDIDPITISNGGAITTNSVSGAAGNITINLPSNGLMFLTGTANPGTITTSSGAGTGGQININNPFAIISNGGQILALGQSGGANVQIASSYYIRSSDRPNLLSVDGSLLLDSDVQDVSQGADTDEVTFVDPLGVMRGRCPVVRAGGATSRLGLVTLGPYVRGGFVPLDRRSASILTPACRG